MVGQSYVFEEGEAVLTETLGLSFNAKQIERISEHYGGELEEHMQACVRGQAAPARLPLKDPREPVYMMIDGSMIYTREQGWKEMKVGRLFNATSRVEVQPDRQMLTQSLYVCQLGGHREFLEKWEAYTAGYPQKICIADGAKWIWNWVEDHCSGTLQILDFYHAVEKLGAYAAVRYPQQAERKSWLEAQKQRLTNNEVDAIIEDLQTDIPTSPQAEQLRLETIGYYKNNRGRMQYKTYLEKGYIIGSGAIESAHRNVVQQRLKLSGQRWSTKGAQRIVNLRACRKSNQWQTLINLIKSAA